MATKTIHVGSNGLKLSVHEDHLTIRNGWRPGVRIDTADLVHLTGLLTVAAGAGLGELVATNEVLNGRGNTSRTAE